MINAARQDTKLIRSVENRTFKELVLDAPGPVIVEFMSYGCAHCRAIEPVLQQAAVLMKTTKQIFRVNVPVEQDLANDYEIESTPTFVMFFNGQEVGRVEGPHPTLSVVMNALSKPFEAAR